MAVKRKTAAEFASDIESAIKARNNEYDTKIGPVSDLAIYPIANVLELQNDRIWRVQQLLSLVNDGSFTDEDLDEFVYNEGIVRLSGGRARVTLIFTRSMIPTSDLTVKANFPVATLADESTGIPVTFLTLSDTTLPVASAASYFNVTTQRYELPVVAEAISGTSIGNVGANRVIRPLRSLNGFDGVFNREPATGGRDPESNDDLIDRYYISLVGSSPSVVNGIDKILRDKFPSVEDSNVVYGSNPLNTRSATDGGAVDVYVMGTTVVSATENIVFTGVDQIHKLSKQPVVSVSSVGTYVQGVDYELVSDVSGYSGSIRGNDGIRWFSTGTIPNIGAVVSVTYTYNMLMQTLQDVFKLDKYNDPGRDILFKAATRVDITLSANIKIRNGFSVATTVNMVSDAIMNHVNALRLGDPVEGSDVQLVVRSLTAVDNFIITNMTRVGAAAGYSDISISPNEYAKLTTLNLALTVV